MGHPALWLHLASALVLQQQRRRRSRLCSGDSIQYQHRSWRRGVRPDLWRRPHGRLATTSLCAAHSSRLAPRSSRGHDACSRHCQQQASGWQQHAAAIRQSHMLYMGVCCGVVCAAEVTRSNSLPAGKRRNKTHTLCRRCGRRSYHIQKTTCSSCGYPAARIRKCECGSGHGNMIQGGVLWLQHLGRQHVAASD